MAIHQNLADLSAAAIDEYIELARIGLRVKKPDGGCLGYPSTLLLFCVIDALSNRLGFLEHSFGALNHQTLGLNLTEPQIKSLKKWYRHLLAHNGMIAPGTILTPEPDGAPIELVQGEPVKIRVIPLFRLVEKAWQAVDSKTLKSMTITLPTTPIDFSGASLAFPVASSGCMVPPKVTKL
jgi:hypothetical protein